MGGNSAEEEGNLKSLGHQMIDIKDYEDGSLGHQMIERMRKINIPVSPSKPTVGQSPCIFKLPDRFKDKNGKSNVPQMVFIGPYYGDYMAHPHRQMQELKWQCLKYLLKNNWPDLNCYIDGIRSLEIEAKACYSEKIDLSTDEFLEMMVLDGCFILELLSFTYSVRQQFLSQSDQDFEGHPLACMERGILPKIYGDLLFLDNQIPFFVLEKLFEISKMTFEGTDPILSCIVVNIFSEILGIERPEDEYYSRFRERKLLHLLHIVRLIFTLGFESDSHRPPGFPLQYRWRPFNTIPSISKLRRAGIKVKQREKDNFLKVKFLRGGVIEMPIIILNELMCSFLVNSVAFEQCHNKSPKHFSVYALFLDCLVNTAGDVEYLCDHGVIENYIETDVAASFINDLGKGMTFNWDYLEFFMLCHSVNEYYQNRLHRHWTSFKGEYFDKPWLCISVFGGVVLLVLSFLQTNYTIHPKH